MIHVLMCMSCAYTYMFDVVRNPESRIPQIILCNTLNAAPSYCHFPQIVSVYLFRVVCVLSDVLALEDTCELTTPDRKTDITNTCTKSVLQSQTKQLW